MNALQAPRLAFLLPFALATMALWPASHAHARDVTGSLGLGAESPLAINAFALNTGLVRIPGASLRYQISESFGLQLMATFQYGTEGPEDSDNSTTDLLVGSALRGHFAVVQTEEVHLGLVFGAGLSWLRTKEVMGGGSSKVSSTLIGFDIGLRPEWFLTRWFSIHTQVGITFGLLGTRSGGMDQSGTSFGLGRAVDLLGNAGFTFWFGGVEPITDQDEDDEEDEDDGSYDYDPQENYLDSGY